MKINENCEEFKEIVMQYVEGYETIDTDTILVNCPYEDFFLGKNCNAKIHISFQNNSYHCEGCNQMLSEDECTLAHLISVLGKISEEKAQDNIDHFLSLQVYARRNNLDMQFLKENKLELGKYRTNTIKIPYFDENGVLIATKKLNGNNKPSWEKNSKTNLYGLWKLKNFDNSYIVLDKGEDTAHVLWYNNIQALTLPEGINFKKEHADILNKFDKIFIHSNVSMESTGFIRKLCNLIPYEKLYRISASKVDKKCTNLIQLHLLGKLNYENLINTAEKVEQEFYDRANNNTVETDYLEPPEEHVKLAEKVMNSMNIKYYNENFYVYENGVYHKNLPAIEKCILTLNRNVKKHLRAEILDYIRINKTTLELDVNEQFINFKNGLYDLKNRKLVEHSPEYFTTCQINANYIEDISKISNYPIDNFINDITCHNAVRRKTLLQIIGYAMTFKVDFQKAFFFYRSKC